MEGSINNLSRSIFTLNTLATVSELPISSMENTISVITQTSKRKVYVSDKAPQSPQAGDIWVILYEPIDAFRFVDENIELYPVSVAQYSDSQWLNKEAYIYQTTWKKLATTLFCNGTQFPQTTGTWISDNASATLSIGQNIVYTFPQSEEYIVSRLCTSTDVTANNNIYIFVKASSWIPNPKVFLDRSSQGYSVFSVPLYLPNDEWGNSSNTPPDYEKSYKYNAPDAGGKTGKLKIGIKDSASTAETITISAIFVL